jgi:DNA-3-methyladenine glycosylase
MIKLNRDFYIRDVLAVAPELLGKSLVVKQNGKFCHKIITEVEAYRGMEDLACHASKGRTKRTEIMFQEGGRLYIYLIYGMYWMLNIVTGKLNIPQAILIRGIEGCDGPGKLTRLLGIDKSYYGENLVESPRIWLEDNGTNAAYHQTPRINIDYAGNIWKNKPWRYVMKG